MDHEHMIPLGYMLKKVESPPPAGWSKSSTVTAIHSVSNCLSSNFADYIPLWKHNGWWLFDTPEAVRESAANLGIAPDTLTLFYYEAFDQEYDDEDGCWHAFGPEPSLATKVLPPVSSSLSGFDVVTFSEGSSPECSPLSCNGLADELPVNGFCLFDNFEDAHAALARDDFKNSEPGPYRIIAVYEVNDLNG